MQIRHVGERRAFNPMCHCLHITGEFAHRDGHNRKTSCEDEFWDCSDTSMSQARSKASVTSKRQKRFPHGPCQQFSDWFQPFCLFCCVTTAFWERVCLSVLSQDSLGGPLVRGTLGNAYLVCFSACELWKSFLLRYCDQEWG